VCGNEAEVVHEIAILMKFDAARANAIFDRLGDLAFTGPESEDQIAKYVAGELKQIGWNVERREVEGSRFPQRVGLWVGWLSYGALITVGYGLLFRNWLLSFCLAFLLMLITTGPWLNAIFCNQFCLGRRRRPLETAPLLIGSLVGEPSQTVRVVFQAVLGGLKTDFFQSLRQSRFWIMSILNVCFWFAIILASLPGLYYRRYLWLIMFTNVTLLFVLIWGLILYVLHWEYYCSGPTTAVGVAERRGLAVLLELARSWPRSRSRQIEPIFIAAGGQRLNYAGSREVVRFLESEATGKPTLLVLFFAPGAGDAIRIAENAPLSSGLRDLAKDAAASLWIPTWGDDPHTLLSFWPFEKMKAVEPIALIGSNPKAFFDASVSPEALHRAAQLATEIALRWAKKQTPQAPAPNAPSPKSESSNERVHEPP
jgi:hypothetical protein